jgi:hypothetical protein
MMMEVSKMTMTMGTGVRTHFPSFDLVHRKTLIGGGLVSLIYGETQLYWCGTLFGAES